MLEDIFGIRDRVAVVTGGSSGIGFAIAQCLAEAGARVAIVNRRPAEGSKAAGEIGKGVSSYPADVCQRKQLEEMVEAVERDMGPVQILVNSAGINIRKKAIEFETKEWDQIIDINLKGTFLACQVIGQKMLKRKQGRVLNISSVASSIGLLDRAPYCASKGGVSQLTKCLAIEWAPYNVTVNAVGPGYVRTPLIEPLINDPDFQEKVESTVPLGRVGETEDLRGIVLLLCSDAAAYITGQTMYVDGGWSIW